jgi:predicted glycoside hydrolase/deacetylase ChbG (UPF0249 family)
VTLVVMADDYGISPGVSAGILDLLDDGDVDGTTAMTLFPEWEQDGPSLRRWAATTGVHLTLTDHPPLTRSFAPQGRLPPLSTLALSAYTRTLDPKTVHAELSAQIARYRDVVGHAPRTLDGHHHVHQLPVVRDVVVALAKQHGCSVRTCWTSPRAILATGVHVAKATGLALSAVALRRTAAHHGVPTNAGFLGVYDFDGDFEALALRWLASARAGTVWMTHPGYSDATLAVRDRVTTARDAELAALRSPAVRAKVAQIRSLLRGS